MDVLRFSGKSATVDGDLFLRNSRIETSIELFSAEITGTLCFANTKVGVNEDGTSINLITSNIEGKLELKDEFRSAGTIFLDDAQISGSIDCSEGIFLTSPSSKQLASRKPWDASICAISALRVKVGGSLLLRNCRSKGEICFEGAKIGGDVDCRGSKLEHASFKAPFALRFARTDISGNVYLGAGFRSFGKVHFNGAEIKGIVNCVGGTFRVPETVSGITVRFGSERVAPDALSLVGAEVKGALCLAPDRGGESDFGERSLRTPPVFRGSVDLKGAQVRVLMDNAAAWPNQDLWGEHRVRNVVYLDGFSYKRLYGPLTDAKSRLAWLEHQPKTHLKRDFRPQPFEQLITVLRNMGHPLEAKRIAIKREDFLIRRAFFHAFDRWHYPLIFLWAFAIHLTKGLLIGHGYRPLRVLPIMAVVGVLFGWYYLHAAKQGAFAPKNTLVLEKVAQECRKPGQTWVRCLRRTMPEYPRFNPWIYSANVLFPVVDLFQEKSWAPIYKEVVIRIPLLGAYVIPAGVTKRLVLVELIFGSVASLLAVAAFTGLIRTI